MKAKRPIGLAAVLIAAVAAATFIMRPERQPVPVLSIPSTFPATETPVRLEITDAAKAPASSVREPLPSTPAPARQRSLPVDAEAARLYDLSRPILQQRFAVQQRIDAFAAAAGDFKDVIPVQVKRYQEPEAVLTMVELLRDPQWSPMFLDYIQHRHGLEYIREWLQGVETSLGLDAGFSSVHNSDQLRALLLQAEVPFRRRSDEIAAKFQLDEAVATDAREVAMLNTLQTFLKAYRYWAINKNREE